MVRNLCRFLIPGILTLFLAACAVHHKITTGPPVSVIYPPPPDTARIQFLTKFSSSTDLAIKRSALSRFVMGESDPVSISKPYGIAVKKGRIYVCDTGLDGLEILDLEHHTFDYFIPKGQGQLKMPLNCFVDDDEKLYVADGERLQVVVFDRDGNYLSSFGEADTFKPTDVFVMGDKIWVSNSRNNRVLVYEKGSYKLVFSFPDSAEGEQGYLYTPTNIFVNEQGIYVSDIGDFKVKKYDHEGKFISSTGSNGMTVGQFSRPKGIAVDHEGNLYAVDAGFENTQVFDRDGKVLMFFGGPYNGPGDNWLPAKVVIDYDNLKYFTDYVYKDYNLRYLVLVTNQYGPDKVNVYGSIEPKK